MACYGVIKAPPSPTGACGESDEGSESNEKSCHFYDPQQENHETRGSLKEAEPDKAVESSEEDDHHTCSGDERGSLLLEASLSKYQFSFGNNISRFVEEPRVLSFTIQELYAGSIDSASLGACDSSDEAAISPEKVEDFAEERKSVDGTGIENPLEEEEERGNFSVHQIAEKAEAISSENELVGEEKVSSEGRNFTGNSSQNDLALESVDSNDGFYTNIDKVDSFTREAILEAGDNIDSCTDKGSLSGGFWPFEEEAGEEDEEKSDSEASYRWDEDLADPETASSIEDRQDQSDDDDDGGYIEMELRDEVFSVGNSGGAEEELEHGERGKAEFDDQNDMDSLWEHDEIIEQLKLELKNARTGGLPTILEESETEKESVCSPPPKMADDLMKPLKITDQKLEHKDRVMEIQKVYKSYAERMRKLDVLNYQTMHAIGLVHLKDPLRSNATQRPSSPMIKYLLSQNLLPIKLRRNKIDPTAKSMEAYYGDLEMVYVGQVCLSWEILQWQYSKSRELLESDPYGSHQYNSVAGEFQLFQVLLLRFIENEPFQGPRIENYVKNRCVVRSLLQVPALRDDSFGEKKAKGGAEDAVPYPALMEIIEESIRLFWDFVRSDKEEGDAIHRACKKTQFNLLDATDLELLIATRNHLQKKEKKLKDIVRSGNCIVRRFQKHRNQADQTLLLVLAQVEVRLISRVLNMAKVTKDQVLWCCEKLDRINFVSRKIYVEPSFLLFPC
ncbi:hypothetical protein CRG98_004126 [Punica granatum]|uniref:Uncharacterized protein n=1 Tax=Punica granatum TaxID=22663 RepID=A0A2I0L5Q1_PUNGR|nr:hypothetical protein CRG98_004126 [Punica granatum]